MQRSLLAFNTVWGRVPSSLLNVRGRNHHQETERVNRKIFHTQRFFRHSFFRLTGHTVTVAWLHPMCTTEFLLLCATFWEQRGCPSEFSVTAFLIGNSHCRAKHQSVASLASIDWKTPLGIVPTNVPFVDALLGANAHHLNRCHGCATEGASPLLRIDNNAHKGEHSIENQLPMLQRAICDAFSDLERATVTLSVVAVTVASASWDDVAYDEQQRRTSRNEGKRRQKDPNRAERSPDAIVTGRIASMFHAGIESYTRSAQLCGDSVPLIAIIGTTDLTHAGPMYGNLPPNGFKTSDIIPEISAWTRSEDAPLVNALLCNGVTRRLETSTAGPACRHEVVEGGAFPELVLRVAAETNSSACGLPAAATLLDLWERFIHEKMTTRPTASVLAPRMLQYCVSGEIVPRENVTGFVAIEYPVRHVD